MECSITANGWVYMQFLFGNVKTYSYLCKKITYTPCYKIVKIMEKEETKNNEKYSIPIYENGVKTEWTIDGVIGDEKYFELLKYGNGKDLPDMVNVGVKK